MIDVVGPGCAGRPTPRVITVGKQSQGRCMQPLCRGILRRQWTGFVEYALCTNSVHLVTDPDRHSSTESLKAHSDIAAVQFANHHLQIGCIPHARSPFQSGKTRAAASGYDAREMIAALKGQPVRQSLAAALAVRTKQVQRIEEKSVACKSGSPALRPWPPGP